MSDVIAIGVGCRKGCASEAIAALVRRALAQSGARQDKAGLYCIDAKAKEAGLIAAAAALQLPLRFFTREQLAAQTAGVETRSLASERRFGAPSIAEASALAGAGAGARLILRRIAQDGATCAIARGQTL